MHQLNHLALKQQIQPSQLIQEHKTHQCKGLTTNQGTLPSK